MIKITTIKTTRTNRLSRKLITLSELAEAVRHDTPNGDIQTLRFALKNQLHSNDDSTDLEYESIGRLPIVYPAAELSIDDDGNKQVRVFNGLLTLTAGPLHDEEEAARVKALAAVLPTTVAAIRGCGGHSVKIIVRATRPDGTLPKGDDALEAFCRQAYPLATSIYQGLLQLAGVGEDISVEPAIHGSESQLFWAGFRMTYDASPYLREDADALFVPDNNYLLRTNERTTIPAPADEEEKEVGHETRQLIEFFRQRYALRQNMVMGYTEYRPLKKWHQGWRPVDERVLKGFTVEARIEKINVWDLDVSRYMKSSFVKAYDPIEEYLWNLHGKWDGLDHIGNLAKAVPTDNPHWPMWFRTWFLGMVAQWMGKNTRYGNSLVPLLISKQGYNKSTFCRSLLPPELKWGFTDNLVLSEKKAVLQAMSQFLLINLDEFNQISPKVQQGFLKNIIQLASVKVKRPYGKHVEDLPRLASFIATSNMSDVLTDPSGNRRFIGVEITGPIRLPQHINYEQLYAQALALLEQGDSYWLDDKQTRVLMDSNKQFRQQSPEELFFHECFDIPASEDEGQFMTPTAILNIVKRHAGSALPRCNVSGFGRILANMEGLIRDRANCGTVYLVTPKLHD